MNEEQQLSANTGEVAETQQTQESSVNTSEVANPNPVQSAETNAFYAEQRRQQEFNQYRQQAETYQQQLDRTARLAGYQSHEEMIAALDEIERAQQQQEYEQAGINPDILNKFLEQHPAIQYANQLQQQQQEQQRLSDEWGELAQEFPNITPEQIPAEVFQLQQSIPGLRLLDAYNRVQIKNLSQQAEQQAIQKLQQNNLSSPGSLGGGDVSHSTNVSKLSSSDFNNLVNQVLRGERKNL